MEDLLFEPIDQNKFNETDVREEVLAPLIRKLGYKSGTENEVIREQSLRYPHVYIGRKKSKSDPLLRGKADYILEAGGKVRCVIEAKAPDAGIDIDAIEQAFTYANHPEIRAVYFVLSNGKHFAIFQTNQGPEQKPIMELDYEELNEKFLQLKNLIGPSALLRDFPSLEPDLHPPLGPGLRSVVRVINGLISYENNSLGNPLLNDIQMSISDGAVERDDTGKMIAFLNVQCHSKSLQELSEKVGLASFEMISTDKQISISDQKPTTFIYNKRILFPEGEKIPNLNTKSYIVLVSNISIDILACAEGVLQGNKFSGKLTIKMKVLEPFFEVHQTGSFDIYLA